MIIWCRSSQDWPCSAAQRAAAALCSAFSDVRPGARASVAPQRGVVAAANAARYRRNWLFMEDKFSSWLEDTRLYRRVAAAGIGQHHRAAGGLGEAWPIRGNRDGTG